MDSTARHWKDISTLFLRLGIGCIAILLLQCEGSTTSTAAKGCEQAIELVKNQTMPDASVTERCSNALQEMTPAKQREFARLYAKNHWSFFQNTSVKKFSENLDSDAKRLFLAKLTTSTTEQKRPDIQEFIDGLNREASEANDTYALTYLLSAQTKLDMTVNKDYQQSALEYRNVIELAEQRELSGMIPYLRLNRGVALYRLDEKHAALQEFGLALEKLVLTADRRNVRRVCRNIGGVSRSNSVYSADEHRSAILDSKNDILYRACLFLGFVERSDSEIDADIERFKNFAMGEFDQGKTAYLSQDLLQVTAHRALHRDEDFITAVTDLEKLIEIGTESNDPQIVHYGKVSLGWVFAYLRDYPYAVKLMESALDDVRDSATISKARVLNALGWVYAQQEQHETAVQYYEKLFEETGSDAHQEFLLNASYSQAEIGLYDVAFDNAKRAVEKKRVAEESPDMLAPAVAWLAERHYHAGDIPQAKTLLDEANSLMEQLDQSPASAKANRERISWQIDYHETMAKVLRDMNDEYGALEHDQKRIALLDARFSFEKIENAANFELRMTLREKETDLAFSQQAQRLAEVKLAQSQTTSYFVAALSGLAALIAFLFYRGYRSQRVLAATNQELAETKELYLKETNHRANNNLQLLSSLLRRQLHHPSATNRTDQQETFERVRTMAHIQNHIYTHDANELVDCDEFVQELLDLLNKSLGRKDVILDTTIKTNRAIAPDHAIPLGLLISEVLTNTFKHAFPDRGGDITIKLVQDSSLKYRLTIHDNGIGFDVHNPDSNGIGLSIIRDLAVQLGAVANVESDEGGTHWSFSPITLS